MLTRDPAFIAVAVVRYADACPPSLHPDCPFSVGSEGSRTCHTECRDVATRLAKPGATGRGKRTAYLYDARQFLLSESGKVPTSQWHTASLMLRLQHALGYPPAVAGNAALRRHIDATNALAYLGQRGFDPDGLVREGLAETIKTNLQLWLSEVFLDDLRLGQPRNRDRDSGWLAEFGECLQDVQPEASRGQVMAAATRFGFEHRLDQWLKQAPLSHLVDWRHYPTDPGSSGTSDPSEYVWLVERFTKTYLLDWREESLFHEYRYLDGGTQAGVPPDVLMDRSLDENTLSREIARRAVEGKGEDGVRRVTRQAVSLLSDGKREEAAALFDAARILHPLSVEAHNNYGFCLLVDDPKRALDGLLKAEELEEKPNPLNRVNQMVALARLDRFEESLAAAESAFHEQSLLPRVAWLWEDLFDGEGEPHIADSHPVAYLCSTAREIAKQVGRNDTVGKWATRYDSWNQSA